MQKWLWLRYPTIEKWLFYNNKYNAWLVISRSRSLAQRYRLWYDSICIPRKEKNQFAFWWFSFYQSSRFSSSLRQSVSGVWCAKSNFRPIDAYNLLIIITKRRAGEQCNQANIEFLISIQCCVCLFHMKTEPIRKHTKVESNFANFNAIIILITMMLNITACNMNNQNDVYKYTNEYIKYTNER